jgi:hypothetical protein
MLSTQAMRERMRVLLVSDDDAYSAELKPRMPGFAVLSLTESSVWMANRAGLDVTRGVDAVLLDQHTSPRLQFGLYKTLRTDEGLVRVPIIFTRSKMNAASAGFDHDQDFYQPEGASPDETARLVAHVLGVPPQPVRREPRREAPGRETVRAAAPAAAAVASRARRAGAVPAPGLMQRLALWGIATVLIGFTFWPLIGSGPVREAVYEPLQALSGSGAHVVNTAMETGRAR